MANRQERRSKSYIRENKHFQKCVTESARVLGEYFKEEPEKIVTWLYTTNPFFGHTAPAAFMHLRPEKYLKILKNLEEGNIA